MINVYKTLGLFTVEPRSRVAFAGSGVQARLPLHVVACVSHAKNAGTCSSQPNHFTFTMPGGFHVPSPGAGWKALLSSASRGA